MRNPSPLLGFNYSIKITKAFEIKELTIVKSYLFQ